MRLGLLGGGSIATAVAKAVAEGHLPGVEIVAVAGATQLPSERVKRTAELAGADAVSVPELVELAPAWVLEAAGARAVHEHLLTCLNSGANAIVMSVGALLDEGLWEVIQDMRRQGRQILLPSGAIGGLDAVSALNALGDLNRAQITTTKAPGGLEGAPYLENQQIMLREDERVLVFEGNAREAVAGFPANVNVAAALSFAGVGPERTCVRIVADSAATRTRHEVLAEGAAGRVLVEIESNPNPTNPRSSYLAALSAIATVRSLAERGL